MRSMRQRPSQDGHTSLSSQERDDGYVDEGADRGERGTNEFLH